MSNPRQLASDDIDRLLFTDPTRDTQNNRFGLVPIIYMGPESTELDGMGAATNPLDFKPFDFSHANLPDFPKFDSFPKISQPKISIPKLYRTEADRKKAKKWLTLTTILNPLKGMTAIMSLFWDDVVARKIEQAAGDAVKPFQSGINNIIAQIDKSTKQAGDYITGNFKSLDINQVKNFKGLDLNVNNGLKVIDDELKKSITALGTGMSDLTAQATKHLNDNLSSKINMVPVDVNNFVREQFNIAIPEIRKISPELQNFTREDNIKVMNQQLELTKSQTNTIMNEMKAIQKEIRESLPTLVANETYNTLKQKGFGNLKITGLDGKPIALPVSMSGNSQSLWATDVLNMGKHINHMKRIFAKQGVRLSDDQANTLLNAISFKLPEPFTKALQAANITIPAIPKFNMPPITLPRAVQGYIPQVNFASDMRSNIRAIPAIGFNKTIEQLKRKGWIHVEHGPKNQMVSKVQQYRKAGGQVIQLNVPGQKNIVDVWVLRPSKKLPNSPQVTRSVARIRPKTVPKSKVKLESGGLYSDALYSGENLFTDDAGPHEPIYQDSYDFRNNNLLGDIETPDIGAPLEAFKKAKQVRAENIKKRREAQRQAQKSRQKAVADAKQRNAERLRKNERNRRHIQTKTGAVTVSNDYPMDLEGEYGYQEMGLTALEKLKLAIKPAPKPVPKTTTFKKATPKPVPKTTTFKKASPKPVPKTPTLISKIVSMTKSSPKPVTSSVARPPSSETPQAYARAGKTWAPGTKSHGMPDIYHEPVKPTTTSTPSIPVQESSYAYMVAGKIWAPGTRSHGMPKEPTTKPATAPKPAKKFSIPKIFVPKKPSPKPTVTKPSTPSKKPVSGISRIASILEDLPAAKAIKRARAKKKMEEDRKKAQEKMDARKTTSSTPTTSKQSPLEILKQAMQKRSEEKRIAMVMTRKSKLIESANTKYANDPARLAVELKFIREGARAQMIPDKAERDRQMKALTEQRKQAIQQLIPPAPAVIPHPPTEPGLPELPEEEQPLEPMPDWLPDTTIPPTTPQIPDYPSMPSYPSEPYQHPSHPGYEEPDPSLYPTDIPAYEPYAPAPTPELPALPDWATTEQEPAQEPEEEPESEQIITLPETTTPQPTVPQGSMFPQLTLPFDIGGFLSGITASFTNIINHLTGQGQTPAVPEETRSIEGDYPYDLEGEFGYSRPTSRPRISPRGKQSRPHTARKTARHPHVLGRPMVTRKNPRRRR